MNTLNEFDSFRERLPFLLKKVGYNKKQASKEVGISINTIKYYENGGRPDTKILQGLSKLVGVSMEFLLTGEEKEKYISDEEIQLIHVYRTLNEKQQQKVSRYLPESTNMLDSLDRRFKLLLDNRGYEPKDVARALNVTDNTISTYVNGGIPKINIFYQLSKFFEVSMEWFLTGDVEIKGLNEEENLFIQRYRTLNLKEQGKIIGCMDGMILEAGG